MDEERTITLDLGSSPDPLIDPVLSPPMMPPSHIKKKSQAAERLFTALGPPSPRKQTFELDVGDARTPQRLLVTVEADDDGTRSTTRRLFQSPTPKQRRLTPRRPTTVTTTVPLRGLSDDEGAATGNATGNATPRRRGRPRKSGTPTTTTTTTQRKRPGTPAKGRKTGGRASVSPQKDNLTSDIGIETTPRPRTQSRATKRKATSPAKEDGVPGSQPRKRGRPRKQTITAGDVARMEQERTTEPAARDIGENAPAQSQPGDDMEDDIWLATMSEQPTPVARKQQSLEPALPPRDRLAGSDEQLPRHDEPDHQQYDWPEMGGGADSYSEAESLASDRHDDRDGFEDTVMAEEFTMISIGSLPSMQPNSSVMAPAHEELGEATSMIINGALESLRQSQNRPAEEQASAEAPIAVEAQPSFEAAEENAIQQHQAPQLPPPRSPQSWRQSPRRSPRRTTAQPLAKQLAQKSLQQGDRQSPAPRQPPIATEPQDTSAYEDSFSEIPEAVLVAATPRRYRQPQPETEEPDEDIQPSIERPSRVNHSNPQSETNRLLTPDETPSPIQSDTDDHNSQTKPSRPAPNVELPSSPPIESPRHLSDAMAQHIRRNSTETPADQLSSFTSSNMGARDAPSVHLPIPEPQPRPTLSPIVRAGRALQLITSDPPSPPGRDSVLGSPFRGSVPKSSQSPVPMPPLAPPHAHTTRSPSQPRVDALAPSPSRSWLAPLSQMRDFIVRSAQSLSPARGSVSVADGMDDPFGPDPGESTGSGSVRNTLFSRPSRQGHDRDATVSVASSTGGHSVHDDDEMSWQGEGSPAGGSQRSASPDQGEFGAHEVAGTDRDRPRDYEPSAHQPASVAAAELPIPQADSNLEGEHGEQAEEEDEDIWAIEAQRPTPYAPRNAAARQEPTLEPPRRSKIPSPWRQNSRRLIYSDELEQYSDKNPSPERNASANEQEGPSMVARGRIKQLPVRSERNEPRNEEEEFSMLSQTRDKRAPAPVSRPTKKPDLSAFFSSPAVLPDMQGAPDAGLVKVLNPRGPEQVHAPAPNPRARPAQRQQSSGNSLFAQYMQSQTQTRSQIPAVPQKQLEIGRQRSVDLFSPVRKSVERSSIERAAPPTLGPASPEIPEAGPAPFPQTTDMAPRQRQAERTRVAVAPVTRIASPATPEKEIQPAHIPQKMNFTPRQRSSNTTLFQPKPVAPANSLFGNNQISAFFSQSRPQSQQPRGRPRAEEYEEEDSNLASAQLKPLPDRAVSPGKSCIRSPLKPKTPGRVVEFASSTLSPLSQAQARAERRASMSPEKENDEGSQSSVEEENHGTSSSSSSPSLSPSPSPSPTRERHSRNRLTASNTPTAEPVISTRSRYQQRQRQQQQQHQEQHQEREQPHQQPLSTKTWTRAHWLRLDELLQARKRGTLQFQLELARDRQSPASSRARARASAWSRPSTGAGAGHRHPLLGKQVSAQGEKMILEAWHLDVVAGFLAELFGEGGGGEEDGGWDGVQIAKRVFALLVGEERRRLGLVPRFRDSDGGRVPEEEEEEGW